MKYCTVRFLLLWCCWWWPSEALADVAARSLYEQEGASQSWARLLAEAEQLHLPTKFLRMLPPDFISFEFDDLRAYAAEYHPGEHRMRLNRAVSFNAAGRVLKPLGKMTRKELEVLYHELFHAYMDYLMVSSAQFGATEHYAETLLRFAKERQVCRYREVLITPIVQRMDEVEARYLTEVESWEALNETWAVFVGWVVWSQLEMQRPGGRSVLLGPQERQAWIDRFKAAFEKGEFRGYYVPVDPDEQRLAQKRYLAKVSQLSLEEALAVMVQALGFSDDFVKMIDASFGSSWRFTCKGETRQAN